MRCWQPFLLLFLGLGITGCSVKPYAPPPEKAVVEELEVELHDFYGRLEAYATVRGRLSSNVAVLTDAKQSRDGGILYIEVYEQTPRGAAPMVASTGPPPFQSRIPIEILGLNPGEYIVSANGVQASLEIPDLSQLPVDSYSSPEFSPDREETEDFPELSGASLL